MATATNPRAPPGHHHLHLRSETCLHEPQSSCAAVGFNTYEDRDTLRYPQGDVLNLVARGSITKDWNAGLRNPQAKKLAVDTFNGGCRDVHGCVPSPRGTLAPEVPGFACAGAVETSFGPEMKAAYDYLNAPLLPGGFEYRPPSYMMGIRDSGPNSVRGWARTPDGRQVGAAVEAARLEAASRAVGVPVPRAPGCG